MQGNELADTALEEPSGLVFVNCMACKTPIISVKFGGPKDSVISGVGELVDAPPETTDLSTFPPGIEILGKTFHL